jgi:hypothetical protein
MLKSDLEMTEQPKLTPMQRPAMRGNMAQGAQGRSLFANISSMETNDQEYMAF